MQATSLKVTNVKVSWRTSQSALKRDILLLRKKGEANIKFHGNFAVIRPVSHSVVFVVFFQSKYVNCTGIKSSETEAISEAVACYKNLFQIEAIECFKIDSISAVADLNYPINLRAISCQQLEDNVDYTISVCCEPEIFAACRLRINNVCVSIFSNGKLTIVGGKSEEQLRKVLEITHHVLQTSPV
jgi:TATA-box binding protein (TBP) (component of TFIID and TFIIIB)